MVVGFAVVPGQDRVVTLKSVAETSDRSDTLTTPITCPAELVCSRASLHAAASARASRARRLIERRSPQDHNIRTGGRAARPAPARADPRAATRGPHTRRCGTRRSPHRDPRWAANRVAGRRRTPDPQTRRRAGARPRTRARRGTPAGRIRAPAPAYRAATGETALPRRPAPACGRHRDGTP